MKKVFMSCLDKYFFHNTSQKYVKQVSLSKILFSHIEVTYWHRLFSLLSHPFRPETLFWVENHCFWISMGICERRKSNGRHLFIKHPKTGGI